MKRDSDFDSAFAGVQDGQTDNIAVLVSHDDIVVGNFAVGGVARLFKVDIEDVGFSVVPRTTDI